MKLLKTFGAILGMAVAILATTPLPAQAASVSVSIPEAGKVVKPGDRLYFEIEFLYPDNIGRHDFKIGYVVGENGESIASGEFYKAVETQASFVDYVTLPESAKKGLHTLAITITDDTGKVVAADASTSFQMSSNFDWANAHFYILLGTLVAIGGVLMIQIRQVRRHQGD